MTDLTTPRRTRHWPWIAAWMILAIYTAAYASMIRQYRAIPYWDQSGYVLKTYNLIEQWNAAGVGAPSLLARTAARLEPNLYLNASPPLRPPLLEMLPALIWRHRATAHDMAYTWLLLRGAFLMAGAWVLARHVGDARWVPAALAVTLASQGFLKLNQNLYLMDVPFACCALLAAALVARAMRRRSMRACLLAGAGTISLLLIKPQALAFMFPFYFFLLIERIFYEYGNLALRGNARPTSARNPNNPAAPIAALVKFSIALLLLLLAIIYLLQSPYGQAAAYQYKLNTRGFWAHGIDHHFLIAILAGLAAPWLIALGLVATIRALATHPPVLGHGRRKLILFALAGAVWWVCFNLFLSFGIDPRLVWSIAPLVICIAAIATWRIQWCGIIATAIAILWFFLALAVTTGFLPAKIIAAPVAIVGPPIVRQQPQAEIGLLPFAADCEHAIRAVTPAPRDVFVETMACDEFVEADALNLAARWINNNHPSFIHYQAAPWGDAGFDIADVFNGPTSGWYLTKSVRPTTTLSGSAFINLMAIHALITRTDSPIHALFDSLVQSPITQPISAETSLLSSPFTEAAPPRPLSDTLVLWHLHRPLTPKECRDALAFIMPRYQNDGRKSMQSQLAIFERMAITGTSANIITEQELPPPAPSTPHDVIFTGSISLRSVQLTRIDHGALQVKLYWQATADTDLTNIRFFHLNDAKGNILRQADAPQDPFHGHLRTGTLWLDKVTLTADQLKDAASFGIGILHPDGTLAQITPTPSAALDWKNQRLIIPLPPR